MLVPCMVKSRLKVSGGMICRPDHASCRRIRLASIPAMTRKRRPAPTYITPSRLWSTVVTQPCSRSSAPGRAPSPASAGASTLIGLPCCE